MSKTAAKKASLDSLARAIAERTRETPDASLALEEAREVTASPPPEPEPVAEPRIKWDEKHMVYMHPTVKEQLRQLAYDERTNMSRILLAGLDREFVSRGLRSIADLTEEPDWQTIRFTNW